MYHLFKKYYHREQTQIIYSYICMVAQVRMAGKEENNLKWENKIEK